ncbi:MAG: stage III sporulation protein AF, partial [Clostridia bacterium]
LSIVGVIILGVLTDILLPEGQTNKYIKGIFSIVIIFVIISPLPKLLNRDMNFDTIFDFSADIKLDNEFLNNVASKKYYEKEKSVEKLLKEKGYDNTSVSIVENSRNLTIIDYVNVNLSKSSIDKNSAHIDISNKVKAIVSNFLNLDLDQVRVLYGG